MLPDKSDDDDAPPLANMTSRRTFLLAPLVAVAARAFAAGARLSYHDSCLILQKLGYLDSGSLPPLPDHLPRYDDALPLGVNFFRTRLENDRLENLTLKRTFFGRSDVLGVSFRNSDLSQSNLCWNNFSSVDFTDSILEGSDLRSSVFVKVNFTGSDLSKADLRRSTFEGCNFERATLASSIATHQQKAQLGLSPSQVKQIAWTSDEGPEPGGG